MSSFASSYHRAATPDDCNYRLNPNPPNLETMADCWHFVSSKPKPEIVNKYGKVKAAKFIKLHKSYIWARDKKGLCAKLSEIMDQFSTVFHEK